MRLAGVKERIFAGTFSFAEEFANYRDLKDVPDGSSSRTCGHVFDAFLVHCESRTFGGKRHYYYSVAT